MEIKPGSVFHSHFLKDVYDLNWGFPDGSVIKESTANVGTMGSISRLGRFPEGGNGNPLQYSCLENPVDREAW